jgi:hypothetical protein
MAVTTTVILPVGMSALPLITLKPMHTNLSGMTLPEFGEHGTTICIEGLNVRMGEDGLLE